MTPPDPQDKGRGDFLGDDLSEVHTCHDGCPCHTSEGGFTAKKCRSCSGPYKGDRCPSCSPSLDGTDRQECPDCGAEARICECPKPPREPSKWEQELQALQDRVAGKDRQEGEYFPFADPAIEVGGTTHRKDGQEEGDFVGDDLSGEHSCHAEGGQVNRDTLIEEAARAIEPSVFRDGLTWSHSNMPEEGRQMARIQARAAVDLVLDRVKTEIDRVLTEHIGPNRRIPQSRDEWGPKCAGCDGDEFRIDGFCSCECRDVHELAADLLDSLASTNTKEETK